MSQPLTLDLIGETEIRVTRQFQASPEQAYRARSDPALIPKWCLGPDGWAMPVCISKPWAGGNIRHEWARGGEGFFLTGEFVALAPFSRIEHIERMHLPDPAPDNHVVTEFTPHDGGTRMVMTMTLPDAATRDMMLATGMDQGMEISYARLDDQTSALMA